MDHLQQLIHRYPQLSNIINNINLAFEIIKESYNISGKLLIAGSGGSAFGAEHIAGKLIKTFAKKELSPIHFCRIYICVPETEIYKIQEFYLPAYHVICMMLEDYFFNG